MKITAIYPGTFDPITNGHSDLVQRASRIFDRVVLAVAKGGQNGAKKAVFNADERVALAKDVLANMENVEVIQYKVISQHRQSI